MYSYIKQGQISEKEILLLKKDIEAYRQSAFPATVASTVGGEGYTSDSRICKVYFPRVSEFFNTFNILQSIVAMEYIGTGFDVTDVAEIQYASYSKGGHFNWHQDTLRKEGKVRGLTFSINISNEGEYSGGDLLVRTPDKKITRLEKTPGSYIIFPSFLLHKACEVNSGVREAIVLWVHLNPDDIIRTKKWVESGTLS